MPPLEILFAISLTVDAISLTTFAALLVTGFFAEEFFVFALFVDVFFAAPTLAVLFEVRFGDARFADVLGAALRFAGDFFVDRFADFFEDLFAVPVAAIVVS